MTEKEFSQLLQRFKEGNCSDEEVRQIELWFGAISDDDLELSDEEKARTRKKMLARLEPHVAVESQTFKFYGLGMLKIAASVAVILVAVHAFTGIWPAVSPGNTAQLKSNKTIKRIDNATEAVLTYTLPDGSAVELQPGSAIFYDEAWAGQTREVTLVGDAFFRVVENRRKPFFVHGGDVVTKVLGTSFRVRAPQFAEHIEVEVKTGKVSVYEERPAGATANGSEAAGVILTPNERVRYYVKDRHWVTSLVEKPQPVSTSEEIRATFVFSGAPVREVFEHIERGYKIDIIIENEEAYTCSFTGDVSKMDLYNMLQVVCKSIGAHYEVKGTKILVSGVGCTQH